jgi:hypothetical protein
MYKRKMSIRRRLKKKSRYCIYSNVYSVEILSKLFKPKQRHAFILFCVVFHFTGCRPHFATILPWLCQYFAWYGPQNYVMSMSLQTGKAVLRTSLTRIVTYLVPNVCSLHSVYAVHAPKQHVIHQKGPNTTKSLFSRCRGLSGMTINKTWVSRFLFLRPQQVLVQQSLNLSMKARKTGKCFRLFYYILFSFFRKKVKIA